MNKTFNDPNTKYSDQNMPLAMMADAPEIPTPTVADAGKVLTVSETGAYELGEGGSSDIPTPTVEDAGKVLTVGETGSWELGEVGGGLDNAVLAHIYYDDNSDGYVCDKQYSELKTAIDNGICVLLMQEGYPTSTAISMPFPNSPITAEFLTCAKNGQGDDVLFYTNTRIQSDDSIVEAETVFTLTPSQST